MRNDVAGIDLTFFDALQQRLYVIVPRWSGALKVKNAVIDGELVCLDSEGRSVFNNCCCAEATRSFTHSILCI